ncbi:hypothetical protein CL619_04375 [archaeon]|jgi:hypothetical protein|nr:hypothetical protein [archaeon]|tara:strand:- start:8493 stop:9314 length:822 start_codon:yes stop_codon:yes gene_type:complete
MYGSLFPTVLFLKEDFMPLVYKYQIVLKLIDDIKDIEGVDDGLLTFFLMFDAPGKEFGVDTSEVITHIWKLVNYRDFKEMPTTGEIDIKSGEIKQIEDCYFVFGWFGEFESRAVLLIEEKTLSDYIKLLINEDPNSTILNVDALIGTRVINQMEHPPIVNGTWIGQHRNGQKKSEATYKDGELDGIWIRWHENGQKGIEATYKNGELDGKYTSWYENGQKESEEIMMDVRPDGKYTTWYENGQEQSESTYKDGEMIQYTFWDEEGNKIIDATE